MGRDGEVQHSAGAGVFSLSLNIKLCSNCAVAVNLLFTHLWLIAIIILLLCNNMELYSTGGQIFTKVGFIE